MEKCIENMKKRVYEDIELWGLKEKMKEIMKYSEKEVLKVRIRDGNKEDMRMNRKGYNEREEMV